MNILLQMSKHIFVIWYRILFIFISLLIIYQDVNRDYHVVKSYFVKYNLKNI